MICASCYEENPTGGHFCIYCGSNLRDVEPVPVGAPGAQGSTPPRYVRGPRERPRAVDPGYGWDVNAAADSAAQAVGSAINKGYDMFKGIGGSRKGTDDLSHGQAVVIAARWILVVAGLTLALWNPAGKGELQASIVLILGLAVANFFLHSHVLKGRRVPSSVAYIASAADIGVISLVLIVTGGFDTIGYVFYFPALLAISVAFPTRVAGAFTAATVAIYGLASIATMVPGEGPVLVAQLVMLAAVAFCGNVFLRVERDRLAGFREARERDEVEVG